MAALVQNFPQQSATATMLQARPSSASNLQSPTAQQYTMSPPHRNSIHGAPVSMNAMPAYRNSGPIKPYAFTSTPSLNATGQWQQAGSRPSSTSNMPTLRPSEPTIAVSKTNPSMGVGVTGSRDDLSIARPRSIAPAQRPQSAYMAGTSTQLSFAQATPVRSPPERYRRPALHQPSCSYGSAAPSGSGMSAVGHLYTPPILAPAASRNPLPTGERPSTTSGSPADDAQLYREKSKEDRRMRRRSMHTLDSADYPNPLTPQLFKRPGEMGRVDSSLVANSGPEKDTNKSLRLVPPANDALRIRNNSSESLVSSRSSHSRPSSSANRNTPSPTGPPLSSHSNTDDTTRQEGAKSINVGLRPSTDAGKRIHASSPLSRPATMASEEAKNEIQPSVSEKIAGVAPSPSGESPAAKKLAAINLKSRSKTSRLRRAFSFGSAAEFKKATGADTIVEDEKEPSRLHKEPTASELYDAEQERIAKKQEESGLGTSIYGGRLFSGSTDNLSISSTASSASIMIRKMGRGMKKGTRSLVGLFRPKSIVGEPSIDNLVAPEAGQATVSMVTVEAERERVNVNVDPHSQPGGGTGFPRLERNSIDATRASSMVSERVGSSGTDGSAARKSIVGGDRERAEVLAAVRKGILKRRNASPTGETPTICELPGIPAIADSPNSSAPSTPNDDAMHGHRRSESVAIGSEDYFVSALRLRQDSKSGSGTPSSTTKRNATFSPRIVFYDTWPSQEYDRRGEIATCNRLTPMLAQQIKEELNSFKMEMEVHENSKIYTHFF
ncbi:hypothetical protein jhhlp_006923 [Lomentospora prolificans]|uniref:Protein BNI4 n=1 Tax=Lomentospora prolificans TaxID=41688 RepID=A0A2N3N348_9PEZI|nr:hypothetical protein jhhlp_006923 [Lomentospora prolificans]